MQPDWWSTKYAIFRNFIHNVGVITTTKGKIFVNHEKKEDCKGKNPKLITDQTFTEQQKLVQDAEKKRCLIVSSTKKLFTLVQDSNIL